MDILTRIGIGFAVFAGGFVVLGVLSFILDNLKPKARKILSGTFICVLLVVMFYIIGYTIML